jgi:PAS domain S-box-containing protein
MASDQSIKLHSLLNILKALNSGSTVTPAQLARSLEVTERSVYRYITTLQSAGYPIYFDRKVSTYRFSDGYKLTEEIQHNELFQALDLKSRMLGASSVALLSYDHSGQCIVANDAAAAIVGGSREQLLGQNYTTLDSWRVSGLLLLAKTVMATGSGAQGDFQLLSSFNKSLWLHCSMSRFEQNARLYLMVVFHDISEQKHAEQKALQDRDDKYRRLFETLALGVVFQNTEGKIISANPAAERILGLTLDQMQGKTSMDPGWRSIREDGSEISGYEHPSMVALRTGKPVFEFIMGVFNPAINSHSWLSITAIPLFHSGEAAPHQVYTTFSDITVAREQQIRSGMPA